MLSKFKNYTLDDPAVVELLEELQKYKTPSDIEQFLLLQGIEVDEIIRAYLHEISKDFSTEQQAQLLKQMILGDEEAKNQLVLSYLKLVLFIAIRFTNQGLDIFSLLQEGNVGLLLAMEHITESVPESITTFLISFIVEHLKKEVAISRITLHISPFLYEDAIRFIKAQLSLEKQLQRAPTIQELSQELKMASTEVEYFLKLQMNREDSIS